MEAETIAVVTCSTYAIFVFLPADLKVCECSEWKLIVLLEAKVRVLGEVPMLQQINTSEEFLDMSHSELFQRHQTGDSTSGNDKTFSEKVSSWKHVTVKRRKVRRHSEPLELHNQ